MSTSPVSPYHATPNPVTAKEEPVRGLSSDKLALLMQRMEAEKAYAKTVAEAAARASSPIDDFSPSSPDHDVEDSPPATFVVRTPSPILISDGAPLSLLPESVLEKPALLPPPTTPVRVATITSAILPSPSAFSAPPATPSNKRKLASAATPGSSASGAALMSPPAPRTSRAVQVPKRVLPIMAPVAAPAPFVVKTPQKYHGNRFFDSIIKPTGEINAKGRRLTGKAFNTIVDHSPNLKIDTAYIRQHGLKPDENGVIHVRRSIGGQMYEASYKMHGKSLYPIESPSAHTFTGEELGRHLATYVKNAGAYGSFKRYKASEMLNPAGSGTN